MRSIGSVNPLPATNKKRDGPKGSLFFYWYYDTGGSNLCKRFDHVCCWRACAPVQQPRSQTPEFGNEGIKPGLTNPDVPGEKAVFCSPTDMSADRRGTVKYLFVDFDKLRQYFFVGTLSIITCSIIWLFIMHLIKGHLALPLFHWQRIENGNDNKRKQQCIIRQKSC